MELEVFKKDGTSTGEKVQLAADVFEMKPNDHAIYQAVRVYLANQRQGTHKTKTHGEVSGSGKKLWKQKHTGRARVGSVRSPLWKGGGTIFGPVPRDYSMKLPKQVKQLARRSALSYKASAGGIKVVEDFSFDAPRTKDILVIMKNLGLEGKKVLILLPGHDDSIVKSVRNVQRLHIIEARKASTYDIIGHDHLLIQKSAVDLLQQSLIQK